MNELRTQAVLAAACKDQGGYGFKLQNQYLAGMQDLYIHLSSHYAIVEVKLKGGRLSKLQRNTIKRMRAAGVPAGWCVVHHVGGGVAHIWAGPDVDDVNTTGEPLVRERGGDWPISEIIKMCQ